MLLNSFLEFKILFTGGLILMEPSGVVASVTDALTTIAGDVTGVLGGVAPIALGIAGTFLAWRYGMKFFKSISK